MNYLSDLRKVPSPLCASALSSIKGIVTVFHLRGPKQTSAESGSFFPKKTAHPACSQHSSQACNLVSGVDLHPGQTVLSQLPMHLSSWYKSIKCHLLYKPVSRDLVKMSHHSWSLITSGGTDTIESQDLQSRRQTLHYSDSCLLATN